MCGDSKSVAIAYYHSDVSYTTLGYEDLIMTPSWRLLGPLEAADGAVLFGVSTAMSLARLGNAVWDSGVIAKADSQSPRSRDQGGAAQTVSSVAPQGPPTRSLHSAGTPVRFPALPRSR